MQDYHFRYLIPLTVVSTFIDYGQLDTGKKGWRNTC